jgi:hypothetical protein
MKTIEVKFKVPSADDIGKVLLEIINHNGEILSTEYEDEETDKALKHLISRSIGDQKGHYDKDV